MIIQKSKDLYKKYERWVPATFFLLGFTFDACMLRRIDEPLTLIQQAAYILISGFLITLELLREVELFHAPVRLEKLWKYREAIVHFMLGTLLNSYTIFYFKSASGATSFLFVAILASLLLVNEFKHFGKSQSRMHMVLLALSVVSYFISLVPILVGSIGTLPFLGSITVSSLVLGIYFRYLRKKLNRFPHILRSQVLFPFVSVTLALVIFFFASLIPPVPLSISYMGIFHDLGREQGNYQLSYTRPRWKFWQHGDQTFLARPGDAIFCFARIYCPTRFKNQLKVRWLYWDPKLGWSPSDSIALPVVGGREEGYRGYTKKLNYQPGIWRVQVETEDGREIGGIKFEVIADESQEPRNSQIVVQ